MLYFYEHEIPEDYGYIHQDNLPDLNHLRDHVQGIIDVIYGSGNIRQLEFCLDEVCSELDMKLNAGRPVLEKKKQNDLMNWHLGYQRAQIDKMKGRI